MQIKQFEYVQEIAECKSITQAAQKLFISQQALSETLKLLETELGFQIFERSNKGVIPTAAGEKFLKDLRIIMPIVDDWKYLANNVQGKHSMKIFIQYVLSDLLVNTNFMETLNHVNDDITIEWETMHVADMLKYVETEPFCIGILQLIYGSELYCRLEKLADDSTLVAVPIIPSKMVFALKADDSLAKKEILTMADIANKQIVENQAFGRTFNIQRIVKCSNKEACYLPQSVNVLEYVLQHKDTVTYLPEIIVRESIHLKNKKIVMRYLENDIDYTLYLIYNKTVLDGQEAMLCQIKNFLSR